MNNYYLIGQIAELTGISEKRLRYYDAKGILSPSYRDAKTGYRYYVDTQIPLLHKIHQMRLLNIPVHTIKTLLETDDPAALKKVLDTQVLKNHTDLHNAEYRYQQTLEERQRMARALFYINTESRTHVVFSTNIEPGFILFRRQQLPAEDAAAGNCCNLFGELKQQAYDYGLIRIGGEAVLRRNIVGLPPAPEADVQLMLQIKNPQRVLENEIFQNSNYAVVTTVHVGPYETLPSAYTDLYAWAEAHGLRLGTDALEEYYLTQLMTTSPQSYVTQIYVPLEGEPFYQ